MPTLDELTNEEQTKPGIEQGIEEGQMIQEEPSRFPEMMNRLFTAETGPGSISEYVDHPLNFNRSEGLAQMIRGLTGFITNLNLAIIDIAVGALRFSKEKKGANSYDVYGGGGISS